MEHVRGSVLHCSRFGCVVRLDDGRLASFPATEPGIEAVRRAAGSGRRPQFPFVISEDNGRHLRLQLVSEPQASPERLSSSLEKKLIDFWRQTSEWDRNAGSVEVEEQPPSRADRLLPFEMRARRQYRDSPKRPRRKR